MESLGDITTAWTVYVLLSLGALAVFWRITRAIPWKLFKNGLRAIIAALFLTPWTVSDGSTEWAPAIMVMLIEGVDQGVAAGSRGAQPILIAIGLGMLVVIAEAFLNKKSQD